MPVSPSTVPCLLKQPADHRFEAVAFAWMHLDQALVEFAGPVTSTRLGVAP